MIPYTYSKQDPAVYVLTPTLLIREVGGIGIFVYLILLISLNPRLFIQPGYPGKL